MKKFLKTMTVVILCMMLFTSTCFAVEDIFGDNEIGPKSVDETRAKNILGAFQWFGYAIAIGMLVYLGIKYVVASADDKATIKGAAIKWIIGALIIAAASTIAYWLFNL